MTWRMLLAPLLLLAGAVLGVFALVAAMTGEWDVAVLDALILGVGIWVAADR